MLLLFLTCASDKEARTIAQVLLDRKLIVCSKRSPVNSLYYWKGNTENSDEVLLLMESHESKFAEVEAVVKGLHSYEQFVLVGFPVTHMSAGLDAWMKEGLNL